MGDRVIVVCKEGSIYSPGVYLHDGGSQVKDLLIKAAPYMRRGDCSYAVARFCGACHEELNSDVLGMGVLNGPTKEDVKNNFENYSQGDAGVVIIDVEHGKVKAFEGYLEKETFPTLELADE